MKRILPSKLYRIKRSYSSALLRSYVWLHAKIGTLCSSWNDTRMHSKRSQKRAWPRLVGEKEYLSVLRYRDFADDRHKVPFDDIIEHETSVNCPCQPVRCEEAEKLVNITGVGSLWVHRCLDTEGMQ